MSLLNHIYTCASRGSRSWGECVRCYVTTRSFLSTREKREKKTSTRTCFFL
jgi:hypothetical protein